MRGEEKNAKKIILTGIVFDEFTIRDKLAAPSTGDIMLYVILDSTMQIEANDYNFKGFRGVFKAKVFDGKNWNHILINEFINEKENKFSKSDYILHYFDQTKECLEEFSGTVLDKNNRDHYTTHEYKPGVFKGKKGHWKAQN